ncbi:ABC transporter substrate-binding protein [Burkholderia ubonensis]|uniref:ABC transporter substrate-binding protein n=1 Tax=Burkholderia ubonensis TaxID=101571 RepID=UPI000752535E|nr:ABC transporter substrate-binding protein [Burkholderia ubonensis]KVU64558.1 ABC transporter substrate-binding protein [Burkholderia ubonensis]KVU83753.1 ABC transporter substrate-binding protein [Burkholderia ubonensis]KVU93458.1 ABC transporter substrate-binding protein [Burkholderia ubonensis]KWH06753.1 ABC transporter substrate-binding protein [Burkholderia ubonensis]
MTRLALPFRRLLSARPVRFVRHALSAALAASLLASPAAHAAPPLKIGYSDWPGWVAFQVALDKGWFKEAGVDVDFEWFDYSASLDAFSAGKLDAVAATNGDALVTGAAGAKNVMILLTDYSAGNDMIIAKPPLRSVAGLKGKKVGVELGLVDHLLLETALQKHGLKDADVTLVNAKTNELPQVLGASTDVAAIAAWQPNAGEALKRAPGARAIFTSADAPGLIYDAITVTPTSLAARKADWTKVVKVWYRCVAYINDPKTQADAVKIMSARVGLAPGQYLPLLKGTHLLDAAAAKQAFRKGDGLDSIYGSTRNADAFNVRNAVYKQSQDVDAYIDPRLVNAH